MAQILKFFLLSRALFLSVKWTYSFLSFTSGASFTDFCFSNFAHSIPNKWPIISWGKWLIEVFTLVQLILKIFAESAQHNANFTFKFSTSSRIIEWIEHGSLRQSLLLCSACLMEEWRSKMHVIWIQLVGFIHMDFLGIFICCLMLAVLR